LIGPCTLSHNPDRFGLLVRSIISQQISTRAAMAIRERLEQALAPGKVTPRGVLKLSEETLRSAGLSGAKARSVRDLAEKVHGGELMLENLHEATDEEVITQLITVRGIGRWTAEMFLIFSLGRLDVLPTT